MSLQTVLRNPEFPLNQQVWLKLKDWDQPRLGIIYPNGQQFHLKHEPKRNLFYLGYKNIFRFENQIFSVYTEGVEVKLKNGQVWTSWDKIFIPKSLS